MKKLKKNLQGRKTKGIGGQERKTDENSNFTFHIISIKNLKRVEYKGCNDGIERDQDYGEVREI